jgi:N utilization substance protein A
MEWSDDPEELIARALSPAEPTSVTLNEDADPPRARVEVVADEVSQAIGKRGVNIKLASRLTGFEIDVYREIPADEEDIDIEQFGDELSQETIEKLKHIGCDTGKAVLELSADALSRRADLDRETAERVLDIIETEFEKGPGIIESIRHGRFTVESVVEPEEDGATPAEASPTEPMEDSGSTVEEQSEEPTQESESEGPGDDPSDQESPADTADVESETPDSADQDDESTVEDDGSLETAQSPAGEDADNPDSDPVPEETEVKS